MSEIKINENEIVEVALQNGCKVYCRSAEEVKFLYDEIFEKKMYFKHGITLKDHSTVIDAGANIGMFSIFVSQNCKDCRIYALEPIPMTYEVLQKNAERYGNITAINSGVSNYTGTAEFSYFPSISTDSVQVKFRENHEEDLKYGLLNHYKERITDEKMLNRFVNHVMADKVLHETICRCQMTTLTHLVREYQLEQIDLLKIDVEKSEFEALEGIDPATWNKIRQVVMEVHGLNEEQVERLKAGFYEHGFEVEVDLYEELNVPGYFNVYAKKRNGIGMDSVV